MSIERKVRVGFAIGMAILLLTALASAWSCLRSLSTLKRLSRTQEVIHHADDARAAILELEADSRGFVISGDESFLSRYAPAVQKEKASMNSLRRLTIDNTNQQHRLEILARAVRERIAFLDETVKRRRTEGFAGAAARVTAGDGKRLMEEVQRLLDEVVAEEARLLETRAHKARVTSAITILLILFVVVAALVLTAVAMTVLQRDFVRRRRAEEKLAEERNLLRTLFDHLPDYVYVKDRESRHVINNRAIATWLGAKTIEETIGKRATDYFPREIAQQFENDDQRVINSGEALLNREEAALSPDGKPISLLTTKVPLRDGNNSVIGLVGISRDVTEARQAQEKILALNEELKGRAAELTALNKELEAFSYSVSHDLRAPLRHIDGFVKMLQKRTASGLDEKGAHYLAVIAESASEMGLLIDNLLAFSRMGRAEMRHTKFDLFALATEVSKEVAREAPDRVIEWNIASLPEVNADPVLMRQVLVNLFSNAVKYSRQRAQAEITFGCEKDDAQETVFFVRDNGVGFDMKYSSKLFGIFQRLHSADDFEGTGIGLANVQRIIARHGGRVWAQGEVDRGATFYFSIPKIYEHAQTNPVGGGQ